VSAGFDWGVVAHWVWRSRSPVAALTRGALLPAAGAYRLGVWARNAAYDAGMLRASRLPRPSVGVGNLAVGGVGKTPIASFLAGELVRRGLRPGILLRGYGADETREHEAAMPDAVVVADADRHAAAVRAAAAGAEVLVLDDCLQRRDVLPDVLLAVVSAESSGDRRWPLPAGPWREGLGALRRADAVVVSHKTASAAEASALAGRLSARTPSARPVTIALELAGLRPLTGGPADPPGWLAGRGILAVCGIAEPELFEAQLAGAGARVRLMAFGDHHAYDVTDARRIVREAGGSLAIVTTAKDAVKLGRLWPDGGPACWIAVLAARVTSGGDALAALLDRVASATRTTLSPQAAAPPPGDV